MCTLAEVLRNEQASTQQPATPLRNCKMVGRDRRARRRLPLFGFFGSKLPPTEGVSNPSLG